MKTSVISILGFYKPGWFYKMLPYLYIATGILAILMMRNVMSIFSGGMLILAGLTVRNMCKKNREKTSVQLGRNRGKNSRQISLT
jgi:Flp pilus assembly protein protease CpaA